MSRNSRSSINNLHQLNIRQEFNTNHQRWLLAILEDACNLNEVPKVYITTEIYRAWVELNPLHLFDVPIEKRGPMYITVLSSCSDSSIINRIMEEMKVDLPEDILTNLVSINGYYITFMPEGKISYDLLCIAAKTYNVFLIPEGQKHSKDRKLVYAVARHTADILKDKEINYTEIEIIELITINPRVIKYVPEKLLTMEFKKRLVTRNIDSVQYFACSELYEYIVSLDASNIDKVPIKYITPAIIDKILLIDPTLINKIPSELISDEIILKNAKFLSSIILQVRYIVLIAIKCDVHTDDCCVCLEKKNVHLDFGCAENIPHVVCIECFQQLSSRECPLCRKLIDINTINSFIL